MIAVGLVGLGCAVLCGAGFVSSTVRADARLRAAEPPRTSGFAGAPAVCAVVAVSCAAGSLLLLGAAVWS